MCLGITIDMEYINSGISLPGNDKNPPHKFMGTLTIHKDNIKGCMLHFKPRIKYQKICYHNRDNQILNFMTDFVVFVPPMLKYMIKQMAI